MTSKYLEQYLGDGGGGQDKMEGKDTLYDVLKAVVDAANAVRESLNGYQATAAIAVIAGMVVEKAGVLTDFRIKIATCGGAGTTTVKVYVNAVEKGSLSIANDEADGTGKEVALTTVLVENDVVTIGVTAAATGGLGLSATARIRQTETVAVR